MNANRGGSPGRLLARCVPNPKLKFLDQCREVMRFKQLARRVVPRMGPLADRLAFLPSTNFFTAAPPVLQRLPELIRVNCPGHHSKLCQTADCRRFRRNCRALFGQPINREGI
jgi:hypothetical protein